MCELEQVPKQNSDAAEAWTLPSVFVRPLEDVCIRMCGGMLVKAGLPAVRSILADGRTNQIIVLVWHWVDPFVVQWADYPGFEWE